MRSMRAWIMRAFDIRSGEGRLAALAFATLLLLITAHTILETARDALLLMRLPPRELGIVYIAVAICALPAASIGTRAGERFGPRRTLIGMLIAAAATVVSLFSIHTSRATVVVTYVASGLIGSVLVPQFWTLVGSLFTVAQARRLVGPVASAGIVGGVLGSGAAAAAIMAIRIKALLLVSAGVFLATAGLLVFLPKAERSSAPTQRRGKLREVTNGSNGSSNAGAVFRKEPFLWRVALVVVLSTATLLALDYFFKWTVARTIPSAEVGPFVARYYAVLNVFSLVVQLLIGNALVRRFGVAAAIALTPFLLLLGATGTLVVGGAALAVELLKGVDGSLRNSVHRITTELIYLPVPSAARERAKPFIDGALARIAQGVTSAFLLALGGASFLTPRLFAAVVVVLAFAWLATAISMRQPYLGLLRRAVSTGSMGAPGTPDPIDLESAEALVTHLSSDDSAQVVGAMRVLARRGRERLVSTLILLHEDELVLMRALEMFGASTRTDWYVRAKRLLSHPSEPLRIAAARALALHNQLDVEQLVSDAGSRLQGYAALHLALRDLSPAARAKPKAGVNIKDAGADLVKNPRIARLVEQTGEAGDAARLGLLAAIADATPSQRLLALLHLLAERPGPSAEWTELLARASARQQATSMIPQLIANLTRRDGREAIRDALVELGEPVLDQVWAVLGDRKRPRNLRMHLPNTISRFGTRKAAEYLLENIETEHDGLVRYKSIRALGRIVSDHPIRVDRVRVERLAHANLVEYFRILRLRVRLERPPSDLASTQPPPSSPQLSRQSATQRLLVGLLDDKLRQSLERAFRLLKVAHINEDIHRVHIACISDDKHARANAAEFLDVLLRRVDQQPLRRLLRLVADDLSMEERVTRAAPLVHFVTPRTRNEALTALVNDSDLTVATLAALFALEVGDTPLYLAVRDARRERPGLEVMAARVFDDSLTQKERVHGSG
ncbi:MFS transporter [Pendulispora brunnea]|uniref:MFS transporter n=1 Tax=Pendulispora brunnea TaxID=2905690 RepID=A0ABZ2K375_9BACT